MKPKEFYVGVGMGIGIGFILALILLGWVFMLTK